ncbi:MAG: ribonuclease E/G, partial [Ottowia sp.]|nr:ribonuclease E/G [Ottowia sp.]
APRSYFSRGDNAAPAPAPEVTAPATQAVPEAAPQAATAPVTQAAAQPSARAGMPAIGRFELPTQDLAQLASDAGLQWVNSDAERVAAVQAAIAAEPKPVHVPRERPPLVELDEGPLVLVETRKDLRDVQLAFEQAES